MAKKKTVIKREVVEKKEPVKVSSAKVEVKEIVEVKKEPKKDTIFDKYRKHINSAKDGYVKGLSYSDAMEMMRYIESKTNRRLGINVSCAACMIDLVLMFARLEA